MDIDEIQGVTISVCFGIRIYIVVLDDGSSWIVPNSVDNKDYAATITWLELNS